MNILICDRPESLAHHVECLQEVFYPSTFDYAKSAGAAGEKLAARGAEYDLILTRDIEVYRRARQGGLEIPVIHCGKEALEGEEDLFSVGAYRVDDLREILNSLAERGSC